MKKIIVLIVSILLLSGCGKKCIKSHEEDGICTRCQPIIINGKVSCVIIPYKCSKTICDEYEEEK